MTEVVLCTFVVPAKAGTQIDVAAVVLEGGE
jgi:hypothetical protein